MKTITESMKDQKDNQLLLAVRNLIKAMNEASDLNIEIIKENPDSNAFEFSLEYPPYEGNQDLFQRRITNLEVEEFIENILNNIEEYIGCKYGRRGNLIIALDQTKGVHRLDSSIQLFSDKGKLSFHKKIHIEMTFVEQSEY